jgi:hypothetical protein
MPRTAKAKPATKTKSGKTQAKTKKAGISKGRKSTKGA